MGEQTSISWTDMTFNMWWGCWKIAPECLNCYADAFDHRVGGEHWGRTAERRFFGDKHWNEPLKWDAKAKADGVRRRVFVGSMMDWAEIHPIASTAIKMSQARNRLWHLIDRCRNLDWLLLTKRIDDVAEHQLLPWMPSNEAPWPHVWLGQTAGTIESVRTKVHALRRIPAAVHFVSCEPLLEDIPRAIWDAALGTPADMRPPDLRPSATWWGSPTLAPLDWLIVGNESGPKRRPAALDWVRTAREAALAHGVAFHFKQWVEPNGKKIHLPVLDGRAHDAFPVPR